MLLNFFKKKEKKEKKPKGLQEIIIDFDNGHERYFRKYSFSTKEIFKEFVIEDLDHNKIITQGYTKYVRDYNYIEVLNNICDFLEENADEITSSYLRELSINIDNRITKFGIEYDLREVIKILYLNK